MKDSINVKKTGSKGYRLTRTMSEDITEADLDIRIQKVEHDIEAYTDTKEHLEKNKEEILINNGLKIDNDIKAYDKEIGNLKANLQALKDAKVHGQGKATSIIKGNTGQGATE